LQTLQAETLLYDGEYWESSRTWVGVINRSTDSGQGPIERKPDVTTAKERRREQNRTA
jgi:hypothetical protein